MKTWIATSLMLSLVAGLGSPAVAESDQKQNPRPSRYTSIKSTGYRTATRTTPAWYPHDSRALPFGSSLWWRQKEAESGGSNATRR